MADYLKSFIIGSSYPVFIWYFYPVSRYGDLMNVNYKLYSMIAPVFLGGLNMFGLYLQKMFNLSLMERMLLTALIGSSFIASVITFLNIYNFKTSSEWYHQYLGLLMTYLFVFCLVVYVIELNLKSA